MAIETLDDIMTELVNRLGIYGACPAASTEPCPRKACRSCVESDLTTRIRNAVEVERKLGLGPAATPCEAQPGDSAACSPRTPTVSIAAVLAACDNERVDADATGDEGDAAYNRAIDACKQAITDLALRHADVG